MENKEFSTTKKITQELIGGWLLWGILLFGIIYSLLFNVVTSSVDSMVLKGIIAIIMQGCIAYITWKLSTKSTFKQKTMAFDDVPKVMKNLCIFTVVICVINGIYQCSQVNSIIDNAINSNFQLKYTESMMSYLYNEEQMIEYNKQKEETIKQVKKQAYTYLAIVEIGLTAVYIAVLPLEKKEILKYIN